jgi:hypothetical protein
MIREPPLILLGLTSCNCRQVSGIKDVGPVGVVCRDVQASLVDCLDSNLADVQLNLGILCDMLLLPNNCNRGMYMVSSVTGWGRKLGIYTPDKFLLHVRAGKQDGNQTDSRTISSARLAR